MGKIGERFSSISTTVKNSSGRRQGRAFIRILQFFAIMVVLTIFARGAAGVTMPEVEIATMDNQAIRKAEEYSGTVTATSKEDVKLPAELTVKKTVVSPGSTVKKGDELIIFDTEGLEKSLSAQEIALQGLKLELAELEKARKQDDSGVESATKSLASAQKEVESTRVNGEELIATAHAEVVTRTEEEKATQKTFDAAQKYYKSLRNPWGSKVPAEDSPMYSDYQEWLRAKTEMETQKVALVQAQGAREAAQKGVTSAEKSAASDLAAANAAVEEAATALAEAQEAYSGETTMFELETKKQKLEIARKKKEIEEQQKLLEKTVGLVSAGGTVKSTLDGTVTEVTVSAGGITAETDYVRISTGAEGYLAEFPVEREKAGKIKPGAMVSVQQGTDYYYTQEARVVGKSMPSEDGAVTVRAQLATTEWTDGDTVTVTVVESDKQYWNSVPVQAVRPDGDGFYVLVLTEETTILGTQTIAHKVAVTVQDKDNEYAAIEGIYENNVTIVVSSSKPVNDGDMVRIAQAETK